MGRNQRTIKASPRSVFRVLSDPRSYAYWVVGSIEVREADPDWPRAGSRFHHTVGVGPLRLKDYTTVEEMRRDRYLQLQSKTRPLGNARVALKLAKAGTGTRVTLTEDPADWPTALVFMPLTHLLVRGRNAESLERLAELSEGRRPIPGEEPGAPSRLPSGDGAVVNPDLAGRSALGGLPAVAFGAAGDASALSLSLVRRLVGLAAVGPRLAGAALSGAGLKR
jgi:uncharacterized protein YndB with AHSA1/START domain